MAPRSHSRPHGAPALPGLARLPLPARAHDRLRLREGLWRPERTGATRPPAPPRRVARSTPRRLLLPLLLRTPAHRPTPPGCLLHQSRHGERFKAGECTRGSRDACALLLAMHSCAHMDPCLACVATICTSTPIYLPCIRSHAYAHHGSHLHEHTHLSAMHP